MTVTLKPHWLQILLALADRERHGLEVVREVEAATDGALRLWPARLYGSLAELSTRGWIEEVPAAGRTVRGGQPRFYRLTAAGRRQLRAELERMQSWLELARRKRVLEEPR